MICMITMVIYRPGFMIMVINLDTRIDTWQGFGLVQFLIPAPTPPFLFSLAKFRQKAKLKIKKSKKK